MLKFNEERTYGVEIEVLTNNVTREKIAQAIRDEGIEAGAECYNHNTKSYWKVITDSSAGYEIVSPVLKGENGLEQIKKVCAALQKSGCKVDKKCGLHVHHEIKDYSLQNFKNLYISYVKYEKGIDEVMPESRRANNNEYCKSMKSYNIYGMETVTEQETIERIKKSNYLNEIGELFPGGRYQKLNYQSFVKYGTIEFRHHSGTTEAEKIINWVIFSQALVETAKIKKSVTYTKQTEGGELVNLFWYLGTYTKNAVAEEIKSVVKFYKARAKQLRKGLVIAA